MRRYYIRVFWQASEDAFTFAWGQVVIGGILGAVAAVISREVGWIPKEDLLRTIGIALTPYVGIILLALLINAVRAPVKFDNHRTMRIRLLRGSAKTQISRLRESRKGAQLTFQAQLADAVPDDQRAKREFVANKVADFSPEELAFLRWHAHINRAKDGFYGHSDVPVNAWQSSLRKCRQRSLIIDEPPPWGSVERFTYINPDLKEAILFAVRDRPVTPPPA